MDGDSEKIQLISSPLGGPNYIFLMVPRDGSHACPLSRVQKAFFPKGKNPVTGTADGHFLELVNSGNNNLLSAVDSGFSVLTYIKKKMVAGTPILVSADNSSDSEEGLITPT